MTGLQALTGECCISGLNTKDAGEQWETFGSFEKKRCVSTSSSHALTLPAATQISKSLVEPVPFYIFVTTSKDKDMR